MITSLHFPQSIVCYIKKAVAEFKTVEKLCSFITAVGKMIRIHNYLVNVNHNPFLYYRIVVGLSSIFRRPNGPFLVKNPDTAPVATGIAIQLISFFVSFFTAFPPGLYKISQHNFFALVYLYFQILYSG